MNAKVEAVTRIPCSVSYFGSGCCKCVLHSTYVCRTYVSPIWRNLGVAGIGAECKFSGFCKTSWVCTLSGPERAGTQSTSLCPARDPLRNSSLSMVVVCVSRPDLSSLRFFLFFAFPAACCKKAQQEQGFLEQVLWTDVFS